MGGMGGIGEHKVSEAELIRVCSGATVHSIYSNSSFGWHKRDTYSFIWNASTKQYAGYPVFLPSWVHWWWQSNKIPADQTRAECLAKLKAFQPRVCRSRHVSVSGHERSIRPWAPGHAPSQTHGTLLLSTNLKGASFYHSFYESLSSLAFVVPSLWISPQQSLPQDIRVADNVCTFVDSKTRDSHSSCPDGKPLPLVAALWELMGVSTTQLVDYSSTRRLPALRNATVHARTLLYDCSNANPRGYWHIMELRRLLHHRLLPGPAAPTRHVLMVSRAGPCKTCSGGISKSGRGVAREEQIRWALEGQWALKVLRADEQPLVEQLRLFHEAKLVVGPHGAAESLYIFCQRGTPVVEYVHQYAYTNSGLYVGYAHMFGLPYWAVVSAHGSGQYIIDPADVVLTVRAALGDVSATTIDRLIADAPVYQVHGCQDSLNCFEGCCHFPCCPTGLLERTSPWHGSRAPGTVSHKGGFLQP